MRTPTPFILTALIAVHAIGCYGYYPPTTTNLAGRQAELSLTDSGAVVLAARVGQGIEAIDGTLVADSGGLYRMAVFGTRRRDGQEIDWKGEAVSIPHTLVSRVEERRFSRARTSLFSAATVIGLIATKLAFSGAGGATVPGNTPKTPGGGSQ